MYVIRRDGRIKGPAVVYVFQDDQGAIKKARRIAVMDDIEIWQGTRRVAYVVANEATQSPPPLTPDADQHK